MPNCDLFEPGFPPEMTFRVIKLENLKGKPDDNMQYRVSSSAGINFGLLDCRLVLLMLSIFDWHNNVALEQF